MEKIFVHVLANGVLFCLLASVSATLRADQPADGARSAAQVSTLGRALPDTALAAHRGGYGLDINLNNLNAQLYSNKALNNVTGDNTVTQSAFSGASGLATVVQNSGNNVIIQNATILNLKLQ